MASVRANALNFGQGKKKVWHIHFLTFRLSTARGAGAEENYLMNPRRQIVRNLVKGVVASSLIITPVAAFAATQTGNLNVTTTIQVSCDAPSPSGTLNLPFDSNSSISSQVISPTPVRVTVTCYGNPTVNHVSFGDGSNRDSDILPTMAHGTRYMLRSNSDATQESSYLGYVLYAIADTTSSSTEINSNGTMIGTGFVANDNRLTIGGSSGSFSITGKVFESAERTNAFGDPLTQASGAAVPGGTYNDMVVMTVDYN